MKTATSLIIVLSFGWIWAELRCKQANEGWSKCEIDSHKDDSVNQVNEAKAELWDWYQKGKAKRDSMIKATILNTKGK